MELPSYFTKYLKKIQPTRSSRERAAQLHSTLRSRLLEADDDVFKAWYENSFLYGSYARNTAINPIKDVDVCLVLNIDIAEYTPQQVIGRLKRVLEALGYEDKTAYQRRSIRIDMSGTTMDAVPVVPIQDVDDILNIPDRVLKSWIDTHPKAHIEAARKTNKESGGRYIPLVKIVKAWYRYQAKEKREIDRPKPKGFMLEVLVAKYQDSDAPTYAEAFVSFLENFMADCGSQLRQGLFPDIPDPGIAGESIKATFEPYEAQLFAEIVDESLATAKQAIAAETRGESATLWRKVFGDRFPDAPTAAKGIRSIEEVVEDPEDIVDPVTESEISDIDLPDIPTPTEKITLKAELAIDEKRKIYQQYPSASRAIPKHISVKFTVSNIQIEPPYHIRWTVENHGKEARQADQMSHMVTKTWVEPTHWESTLYRGSHYLTCEIIKNGVVVARTKHVVNIK